MPDADEELRRRLREELDRVRPLYSQPRYLSFRGRPLAWRLAPLVLASAMLAIVGLTAYAGSPNPVVWSQDVVNVVHPSESTPTPTQAPSEPTEKPEPAENAEPTESPEQHESPEPSQSPEPSGSPEQHEGGGDDHSDSGSSDSGGHERS